MADYLLTGLWQTGQGSRYVWYGADWPSFQSKANTLFAGGYVLESLDVTQNAGSVQWAGAWVAGNAAQELASGLAWNDLLARHTQMAARGMQLVCLRSYDGGVGRNWAGAWRAGAAASTIIGPVGWDQFWSAWLAQHAAGNRLIDFDTYASSNGSRLWAGVWQPGTGDQYLWVGSSWDSFSATNDDLRSKGYRLKKVRSYPDGASRRWAGVWRTEPGEFALVTDLTESQFWAEWDRQTKLGLLLSAIHIWEGTGYAPAAAQHARVRLHVKIVSAPTIPISTMLDSMREVYEAAGFQVEVASVENLDRPDLVDLDAGDCSPTTVTQAQQQLFAERNNVGAGDIVVYFVRSTLPPYNGCAAYPSGRPGAVIASYATEWTLGHEVGHVLGLYHVADAHRLMTGLGTGNIVDPPPDLIPQEIDTMLASPYAAKI